MFPTTKMILPIITLILLSGCGGGGGSDTPVMKIGTFFDETVIGMSYRCSSGDTGTTDADGHFTCPANDTVAFYIGDLFIGETAWHDTVTPYELWPDDLLAQTQVAQLLQGSDTDTDPDTITLGSLPGLNSSAVIGDPSFEEAVNAFLENAATAKRHLDENLVALAEAALTFNSIKNANNDPADIRSNLTLPVSGGHGVTIQWLSNREAYLSSDGKVTPPPENTGDQSIMLYATLTKEFVSATKSFQLTVSSAALTDAQSVAAAKEALTLGTLEGLLTSTLQIVSNLLLPNEGAYGTTITWYSSDTSVLTDSGSIIPPDISAGDADITLTAVIRKGSASDTKTFILTVPAVEIPDAESVAAAAGNLGFDSILAANSSAFNVISDLLLPTEGGYGTTISWYSSDPDIISAAGSVTRPVYSAGDATVTLTAAISKGGVNETKTFNVTVPALPDNSTYFPLLVIRIAFNDFRLVNSASVWSEKLFGMSEGELNHYYNEISYGQFHFIPAEESQDTPDDGIVTVHLNENHPGDTDDFVTRLVKAANLADSYVDFSAYDKNRNGHIEKSELQIIFIVAGGESSLGMQPGIWAHNWCLYGQSGASAPKLDGVSVMSCSAGGGYTRFGERHEDYYHRAYDATIGIIAHELGHAIFDLPDLYDVDGSSGGIGFFGLMGSGSWGYKKGEHPGETPVHMCGWSKTESDFVVPTTLSASASNIAMNATGSSSYNLIKIPANKANEYFLVENRAAVGYDRGLYGMDNAAFGGGLAIWHIDESMLATDNTDNHLDTHRLVDLEEANDPVIDINNLSLSLGNRTNLFYNGNSTAFGDTTAPNSRDYNGMTTKVNIMNISNQGTTMYMDIGL